MDDAVDAELARLPVHAFGAGALLFDESRSCLGYPLVVRGSIKVFKAFPNGRELLLYHVAAGQTCVASAACLFTGTPYAATGVADGDVALRLVPPPLFETLMDRPAFRRFVMAQFTQRLTELMALVDAVFTHRLDQRLASRLLAHHAASGAVLSITHQQLADELASIREVVTRLLRQFADRGWISNERGAIRLVSPSALRQFASTPD